jgi:hypothetical protein
LACRGRFTASAALLLGPSPAELHNVFAVFAREDGSRKDRKDPHRRKRFKTMSRKSLLSLFLISITFIASAEAITGDNKVEQAGAFGDPGASDALKKVLDVKGWHLSLADGGYCDVWLRSSIAAGKTDQPGAVYSSLGESTLIGVILFAKPTTDFRGQSVKPGSYTLRYALHPADGNHMGISPIRDFLIMLPVAMDPNPDASIKFEEMTRISTKVTGTNHPGVLSLVQIDSAPAAPKVSADDSNHILFSASLRSQSGSVIPIAFIIKGHAEQ